MRDGTARQVSILPFILRGAIETLPNGFDTFGRRLPPNRMEAMTSVERGVLGEGFAKYRFHSELLDLVLFLGRWGVGTLVVEWPPDEISEDFRKLLTSRRDRHTELLSRKSQLGTHINIIAEGVRDGAEPTSRFPSWAFDSEPTFAYAFSMWSLYGDRNANLEAAESGLLFPSYHHVSDTSWDSPRTSSELLEACDQAAPDCDLSPEVSGRATWASLVLSGGVTEQTESLYLSLEIRLQALWRMAHAIGQIPLSTSGLSDAECQLLEGLYERGEGALYGMSDPMVNERTKGIHAELVRTSDIDRVISEARRNLQALRAIGRSLAARRERTFRSVLEFLLFAIACLQVIPLVATTPLDEPIRSIVIWSLPILLVAFLALLALKR